MQSELEVEEGRQNIDVYAPHLVLRVPEEQAESETEWARSGVQQTERGVESLPLPVFVHYMGSMA